MFPEQPGFGGRAGSAEHSAPATAAQQAHVSATSPAPAPRHRTWKVARIIHLFISAAATALSVGAGAAPAGKTLRGGDGLPPIHPGARGSFTAILMWHDVVETKKLVWFDTTRVELANKFAEIRRRGLTPIRLEQLADHLETGKGVPQGSVVLTFDDNNLGLYLRAFPLLKQYRWPAVLFVHTAYVGVTTGKEHCTWDQLREMEASGLVTVQPHTATHPPDLRSVSAAQLEKELSGARKKMEAELGGQRRFFAYPEGHFDARVARAAWEAGYRLAITEDRGAAQRSPNRMMVHRYSMHRRAEQALADTTRSLRRAAPRGR
jgi:peptidoglycan/xylan/chitin deacetylase (PgdA/CDA1 family)